MYRAAKLEQAAYRELAADPVAFAQGMIVVVLVSLALLVGATLDGITDDEIGASLGDALIIMPGLWLIQATSAFVIGSFSTDLSQQKKVDARGLAGAIGMSSAPGLLFLFISVPGVGPFVGAIVVLWMLASMIVAVRVVAETTTTRAVIAVLVGFVLRFVILAIFAAGGGTTA